MMDDDSIARFPIKKKKPSIDEDLTLKVVKYGQPCKHPWFFVDEQETEVECGETALDQDGSSVRHYPIFLNLIWSL